MSSPSRVRALAAQHGVDLEIRREGGWSIECWAPPGKVWRCNGGCHFLSLEGDGWYTCPDWRGTLQHLRESINAGFDNCTVEDCDICGEL